MKLYSVFFFVLFSCSIPVALAEESPGGEGSKQDEIEAVPDRVHRVVGEGIRNFADRIDLFFADERIEAELQTTRIRVKPTIEWKEGGNVEFKVPLKLSLVLPRLQRKWEVFIINFLDEDNDLDPDGMDGSSNTLEGVEDVERSTALGLEFGPLSNIRKNMKFRVGVKFSSRKLIPFSSVRYRQTRVFKVWLVRLTERVFWFEDTGFGERTDLEWERKLGNQMLFRSKSSGTWSEASEGLDLKQRLMLRRFLRENKAISLSYQITGHTHPERVVDGHTLALKYRQRLLREWLFFEIQPQLQYLKDDNFEPRHALFASLEVVF